MNKKQRREYSELHIRAVKRMGSRFVRPIYEALHKQVTAFTEVLKTSTINHAREEIDRVLINADLIQPIRALYRLFGLYQARKTTAEINTSRREQKAGFGINEELLAEIIAYLRQYLLIKVVIPITQTTRRDILAMLIKGEQEGWGVDRIARELERPDFLMWRARMIVRTESLFAMQFGQKVAVNKSRWQSESEWIAANDHRTRHSHRDIDGVKVDEGKKFRVPIYKGKVIIGYDYMVGPGDPTASAGNVINCRCSLRTTLKRDANGRLVLKKVGSSGISVILPQERFIPHTVITI